MYQDITKKWRHTPEEIEKIRQANFNRNYDIAFTKETRKKLSDNAKNRKWTKEARENARQSHLGKKLSEQQKLKIRKNARHGWKNISWRGRYASYAAKHIWAKKYIRKAKECIDKNSDSRPCSKRIELSNKDHKYLKRINDWDWRCTFHHRKYDLKNGLVNPMGKVKNFFPRIGKTQKITMTIDGIVTNSSNPFRAPSQTYCVNIYL